MFGVTEFSAVINPPQAAILAVGEMEPRAVVRDGEIVARNVMTVTLACDHRILYGADAARVPRPHPGAARAADRAGALTRGPASTCGRSSRPTRCASSSAAASRSCASAGWSSGRATYEPGWRWSQHVGGDPDARCQVEHVGLVISGRAAVLMDDGEERVMEPGELFHVAPGHDSWVVGDEPYVSLHFLGAGDYAA